MSGSGEHFNRKGETVVDNRTLNALHGEMKTALADPGRFEEAKQLCLTLHSLLHLSEMSGTELPTYEDELWNGLTDAMFRARPLKNASTIAWCLWHITRIEDATTNILIADNVQVFNREPWQKKLNVQVTDTGNAMTDEELSAFSSQIDIQALKQYRIAVGRNTREILKELKAPDLKRKMNPGALKRVMNEGVLIEDKEDSRWLIDFWGSKRVMGLLLTPVTRHLIMHLNEGMRIRQKCLKE